MIKIAINLKKTIIENVDYKTFIHESKLNNKEDKTCKYYLIFEDTLSGYFIAYDNYFHKKHQYLDANFKFFNNNYQKNFKEISNYFNKPLQIMIASKEEDIINNLIAGGFVLMRRSFDCEFKQNELLKNFNEVQIELIDRFNYQYQIIVKMAYEHYKNTHLKINPLTENIEEFEKVLPKDAYIEILDNLIINYIFVEENELCYMGSNNLNSFKDFANSAINEMFKKYSSIVFEADDTDIVAIKLKSMFSKEIKSSFNTFVLENF